MLVSLYCASILLGRACLILGHVSPGLHFLLIILTIHLLFGRILKPTMLSLSMEVASVLGFGIKLFPFCRKLASKFMKKT